MIVLALNLTGKDRCVYCANSGWVEYHQGDPIDAEWLRRVQKLSPAQRMPLGLQRVVYAESVAPCPRCEQGKVNEFPGDGADGRPGWQLTPWGAEGFWRGRDHSWLKPLPVSTPMHHAEARKAMAAARAAINGRTP